MAGQSPGEHDLFLQAMWAVDELGYPVTELQPRRSTWISRNGIAELYLLDEDPLLQSVEMADERRKISEGVLQPDRDPSPQPPGPKGIRPLNPFTGKPMNGPATQGIPGSRRTATEHG